MENLGVKFRCKIKVVLIFTEGDFRWSKGDATRISFFHSGDRYSSNASKFNAVLNHLLLFTICTVYAQNNLTTCQQDVFATGL